MTSLGNVRIGMTLRELQRAFGGRLTNSDGTSESDSCWVYHRGDGSDKEVGYMIERGQLTRIEVSAEGSPTTQTESGIEIGSSLAELRRAYGAKLLVERNTQGDRFILNAPDHRRAIIFETDGRVVTTFRVGIYPSVTYNEGCE